uniref:Retrotransposon gag domain-containing protein n=1 Tax=Arundo donax TaxID=35708 RepID=A0A0A9HE39_ARUDO
MVDTKRDAYPNNNAANNLLNLNKIPNPDNQHAPPPPSPLIDANQVMAMFQGLVQTITNLQQSQVQQVPPAQQQQSRLRAFLGTQPPTFSQATEPMEADDWLRTIESKLQLIQCTGRERVLFASHQLSGPAQEWWIAYTAASEDPESITWP